ncbi:MAG TPA: carbamoyltransferase N-terminal domain-containing protein [Candidatus Omnitrophota bacterium]|nr:carbamoyltransferase N-terminal domain-containing protein [Candidatus Omnitrophota bacterium]HPT39395.1 carbamoyltransferase N-terminal domain-containing protein [Candidatus Omnitrophota bacterium]
MNILGISCYYHDAAACLIKDGIVVAAAQEERFNRIKNSADFPINAINFCVQESKIAFSDIDYVAFYEKPFLKFHRVVLDHLKTWPFSFTNFLKTMPKWLQDRLILPLTLEKETGFKGKTLFVNHHLSHAASAFLVSPFEQAAILTSDGIGEWATLTCGLGRGNDIKIYKELRYPNSLGLLYSSLTAYLGFSANKDEGTVMALAGCGEPAYLDKFKKIFSSKPDGSFILDPGYFSFNQGRRMYSRKFIKLFGEERKPLEALQQRHCDIASSLQKFTEETLVAISRNIFNETKLKKLCLAGGTFLNCVANSKILEDGLFEELFVQPAAGDAGAAIGAAVYAHCAIFKKNRNYVMTHPYLGPDFSPERIKTILLNSGLNFQECSETELTKDIAVRLAKNQIIGWFQGRMEFGPRALGNRSILAHPACPGINELLNSKVKHREPFRPFAPAVLEERKDEFFNLSGKSAFMLLAPKVRNEKRESIPGVVHVDGTARVQTVNKETNPKFWQLIKDFESITGLPILINTSFNLKGEPIVCSPQDALNSFNQSQMDCLVLGNYIINKRV